MYRTMKPKSNDPKLLADGDEVMKLKKLLRKNILEKFLNYPCKNIVI
jgi:hypothetical protein